MGQAHIITHTHWDRDWFLPQEFINEWLDDLFERLFALIDQAPDYRYVIDGQTSIIDDYLTANPDKREALTQNAQAGNLLLGPYCGQIDWRVVSEESLIRNLYIGISDAKAYGNLMACGWVLDNFGHCSQSPQIHALFGIRDIFLWRGPVFENDGIKSQFIWQGSDGTSANAHYLLSGYRNFYNLSDTTGFIDARVEQMTGLLGPYSPSGKMVFLDGYDIDTWPEDPFKFLPQPDQFVRSSPLKFATEAMGGVNRGELPVISGELFSGKSASVFPGSLSSRMYLRLQNALIERMLAYYLEPLQALLSRAGLASDSSEIKQMWKALIGTQLHDCIGGVSVDQVHDHSEAICRKLYEQINSHLDDLAGYLPSLLDLRPGSYAFLPSPYAYESIWLYHDQHIHRTVSSGSGIHKIHESLTVAEPKPVDCEFSRQNQYYKPAY
jgi:alpha-mannosidase